MNPDRKRLIEVLTGFLVVAVFMSGCATRDLWEKDVYHPAPDPNLRLLMAPDDKNVMVKYDEQFSDSNWTTRRAFWLFNEMNFFGGTNYDSYVRPRFVNPRDHQGLVVIPVHYEMPDTNALPDEGYLAVAKYAPAGFELWRDGVSLGFFDLPSYTAEPPKTFGRIAMTPLVATGDVVVTVVVTAGVVAVLAAWAYVNNPNAW
jgi:hypothetical protein